MAVMQRITQVDDISSQQQNIINVDQQPAKTIKKRRKGQKPNFLQDKISYFDDDYSGERKFSSSELKLKKISYFDDDEYYEESEENEMEATAAPNKAAVVVASQESYEDYESDADDESIQDKGHGRIN